jgi:CNT family concentrative nucleoside transporter
MEAILRGILGLAALLFVLFALSNNRSKIDWKLVAAALSLQFVLALSIANISYVNKFFDYVSSFFLKVIDFTQAGTAIVFGNLIDVKNPSIGYVFAFQALPTIVFFSALSSLLYYFGILQRIVFVLAAVMSRLMRLSGAESLAAAANVFVGQTEAPLIIKPYLSKMTKSEFLCLMTGGMATIAGGVMVAYVGFLGGDDKALQQEFATHLLTASIMSAPAAILAAKMMYPETEEIDTALTIPRDRLGDDALHAISIGTTEGIKLAVNVGAMLIVFTALIALINSLFSATFGEWISWSVEGSDTPLTLNQYIEQLTGGRFKEFNLEYILGIILAPVAWLIGTPSQDIVIMGQLLGKKTILNEFVAYADLPKVQQYIQPKTKIIATYALCGFANFASIGIQLGGISVLAPEKRPILAELGIKSLIAGTFACLITAVIAGMLF